MPFVNGLRIVTRHAAAGDGPRCARIFLDGRRRAFPWQPAERFGLDDYYDCVEDETVLVAEVDGRVVGFVSIDRPQRVVHNLFIDPDWQNRGIGTALLREALASLNGPAELTCAARNAAARAFYEHNGWVPVRSADAADSPHIIYRKPHPACR
ncbi:MAG TPA: GNAT family N-acetyltransferase [Azospirillum sp.]|nr:GNAT family N-acetyltransferase [Azospirillum sp.]